MKTRPAKIKVSGYGVLGNFNLRRSLVLLQPPEKKLEYLDANFVEDAITILLSKIKEDGFLEPLIVSELTLQDGRKLSFEWRDGLEHTLPRPLAISEVRFRVHKGIQYYYRNLEFQGLESISEGQAQGYFVETGFLIHLRSKRVYTPTRLERGLSSLSGALEQKGYESANAYVTSLHRDDTTGAVDASIKVEQGLKSVVRSVQEEFFKEKETTPYRTTPTIFQQTYSRYWLQDFTQYLKTNSFHDGYPDTQVEIKTLHRETVGKLIEHDLLATVHQGPQVTLGKVAFAGQEKTKESIMKKRVRLQEGELLNRIKVEEGRSRLAQLGTFESVQLKYDQVDEHNRGVTYNVREGKTVDISLLFGYGSYELLRAGFEAEHRNIWGLGHSERLKVVQSFKSSSGEYTYTIPDILGRDVDFFLNASALRREEISFLREEYGGGFGLHRYFHPIATDVSTRYNYMILKAADTSPTFFLEGAQNPNVGTIITDIRHDRRDDPLYPRNGYRIYYNMEIANQYLGGDVAYERFQLSGFYHHPLWGGTMGQPRFDPWSSRHPGRPPAEFALSIGDSSLAAPIPFAVTRRIKRHHGMPWARLSARKRFRSHRWNWNKP
ncbi:POTRA domain-containing protein [Pedosphaera parvula]|uniref:Surface antigen variable number repeat protein n=1 Tax=Pedosphaera parvula (strain Ellin514) TaxID=320771 RepID=B9XJP7_PEDPL|nr:POTRA domain-containing protein [Pedosphaera parvula]EEF59923.1 surface antigen variable number repeat protein [Pedosphaera parvula Ellin514]